MLLVFGALIVLQGWGRKEKGHVWFVRYLSACLRLIDTLAP